MVDFSNLPDVKEEHWLGSLITFNNMLIVIGGWANPKVSVFENDAGQWNVSRIHPAPDDFKTRIRLHAIVITNSGIDTLFIFGESL